MRKLIILLSVILYCLLPINDQTIIHTLNCKLVDPDYKTTVGDGRVRSGTNATWSVVHDATAGYHVSYTATTAAARVIYFVAEAYEIYRVFLPFDTSAIPGAATVTAASVNLRGQGKADNEADVYSYSVVVSASQASTTELVLEDYDEIGSTAGSNVITHTNFTTVGWNVYTLNATGLAWVVKAGVTKLGLREGHDMEDVAPDVQNDTGTQVTSYMLESDEAPDADPYLAVTYELDETGNAMMHSIWLAFLIGLVFLKRKCER